MGKKKGKNISALPEQNSFGATASPLLVEPSSSAQFLEQNPPRSAGGSSKDLPSVQIPKVPPPTESPVAPSVADSDLQLPNWATGALSPESDSEVSESDSSVSCTLGSSNTPSPLASGSVSKVVSAHGHSRARQVFAGNPQPVSAAAFGSAQAQPAGAPDFVARQPLWSSLFKNNRDTSKGLKLEKLDSPNDVVSLDPEDMDDLSGEWSLCLVGHFLPKFPGLYTLKQLCQRWPAKCSYRLHSSGWVLFKFSNAEDRETILHKGPYQIFGKSLILKPMPRCFDFGSLESSSMPLWATLPGLPLEAWNSTCLSKIMSKVGTPLATDQMTLSKSQISYARVLVEVDLSKPLVDSVDIRLPHGSLKSQSVCFEKVPQFCSSCRLIGHSTDGCESFKQATLARVQNAKDKLVIPRGKRTVFRSASPPPQPLPGQNPSPSLDPIIPDLPLPQANADRCSDETILLDGVAEGPPHPTAVPALPVSLPGDGFIVVKGKNSKGPKARSRVGASSSSAAPPVLPVVPDQGGSTAAAAPSRSRSQHRRDAHGKFQPLHTAPDKKKGRALPLSS